MSPLVSPLDVPYPVPLPTTFSPTILVGKRRVFRAATLQQVVAPEQDAIAENRLMSAEARLAELGIELPNAPKPMGVYKPVVVSGNMAYLSGHGPLKSDGKLVTGRLGLDLDVEAGYEAARITGMGILATLQNELGSLDKVKRLVKLLGLVRCTDTFDQQPAVINGCSELFRDVFGDDAGVAARSALGSNALPGTIAVEIEAIFEVDA